MPKRIYVGYVKSFNPKTGAGTLSLETDRDTELRKSAYDFNINDSTCNLGSKVLQGMKIETRMDDRGRIIGINPA